MDSSFGQRRRGTRVVEPERCQGLIGDLLQIKPRGKPPVPLEGRTTQEPHAFFQPIVVHEYVMPSCSHRNPIRSQQSSSSQNPIGHYSRRSQVIAAQNGPRLLGHVFIESLGLTPRLPAALRLSRHAALGRDANFHRHHCGNMTILV